MALYTYLVVPYFHFSLCNLRVLCVSVVNNCSKNSPQTQKTRRLHREFRIRSLPTFSMRLSIHHSPAGANQEIKIRAAIGLHYVVMV
jgi:hypothetical protein